MKKSIRILAMILVICLAAGVGALAADSYTKNLVANNVGVKLVVDGVNITPKDAKGNVVDPFIVDGTTYLPVRAVAEALGKEVDWDGTTKTVYIGKKPLIDVPEGYSSFSINDEKTVTYATGPFSFACRGATQNIDRIVINSGHYNTLTETYFLNLSITGTITGPFSYTYIGYKCYDTDDILIYSQLIYEPIVVGEKFKLSVDRQIPTDTARIEFFDYLTTY